MRGQLLLEAHQELAEAIQPGMGHFDDPAARPIARDDPLGLRLFSPRSNVRDIATGRHCLPCHGIIIALICTQMLRGRGGRLWALDHDGIQRVCEQLHIGAIGARHHHGNGKAVPFSQQTALGAPLATVRGIGAGRRPPKGALVMAPSILCQVHSRPWRSS